MCTWMNLMYRFFYVYLNEPSVTILAQECLANLCSSCKWPCTACRLVSSSWGLKLWWHLNKHLNKHLVSTWWHLEDLLDIGSQRQYLLGLQTRIFPRSSKMVGTWGEGQQNRHLDSLLLASFLLALHLVNLLLGPWRCLVA